MTAQQHGSELRAAFHRDVDHLERNLQAMGDLARAALERATRALTVDDQTLCQAVVDADDEIDRRYLDIERRVVGLLARQAPVAADLRLLTAILHVNLHLERVGDMAVNVARLARLAAGVPRKPPVVTTSRRWGRPPCGWWTSPCRASASATRSAASGCR
jgi:phosphate transport system protein